MNKRYKFLNKMKKEIQQLKQKVGEEFDSKFVDKGEMRCESGALWLWTIEGSSPIKVKSFLLSKLDELEKVVREDERKKLLEKAIESLKEIKVGIK